MVSIVKFDRWQNTAGTQYSNIIQAQFVYWETVTSTTVNQSYVTVNGGVLTITPYYTGSKFVLMPVCQGYVTSSNGTNIGIDRIVGGTTTRVFGVNGASGDSWVGAMDNGGSNSYNVCRQWVDSPNVGAGTAITYQVLLGNWTAGTTTVNYGTNYSPMSSLTVLEIQP
jgi:hypothetical protein